MEKVELTLGERRVRTTFNPGNNDKVQNFKERFAHLINDVEDIRKTATSEDPNVNQDIQRLCSMAQTDLEKACMITVKALTA